MAINHLGGNSRGSDMTESQDDKYLKHNDHVDLLADKTQQKTVLDIGFSSGNVYNLSVEDWTGNAVFHLVSGASPSVDADFVLVVPATQSRFGIFNDTGFTCTVRCAGSPGGEVTLLDGARADLHCDGESVEELKRDIYDLFVFVNTVEFEARILGFTAVRQFKLPANLPDSEGYAYVTAGASENDRVLRILKNGVEQGTLTWSPLTNLATISFSSDVTWLTGDRFLLQWAAEESPDIAITLADVSVSIKGIAL